MAHQTKTIGARLPTDQIERIELLAEQRGMNKSDLFREAINEYLTDQNEASA